MKRIFAALFAIVLALGVSAQPRGGMGGSGMGGHGGPAMQQGDILDIMTERLELTEEQKNQIAKVYDETEAEMKKMFDEMENGATFNHEQLKALKVKQQTSIKSILTKKQGRKYDQLMEELKSSRPQGGMPGGYRGGGGFRGGGGGGFRPHR